MKFDITKLPVGEMMIGFLLLALAYTTGCVCLTRWRMVREVRWLVAGLLLFAIAIVPAWHLVQQWRGGPPRPIVVVARDGVLLRKGDGTSFPPWFETPLNRGVEAELLFERDGWLQIELPGGEVGWVSASEAVVE